MNTPHERLTRTTFSLPLGEVHALVVGAELDGIVERIVALLDAGWASVRLVTDHGWLLIPGSLPKTELSSGSSPRLTGARRRSFCQKTTNSKRVGLRDPQSHTLKWPVEHCQQKRQQRCNEGARLSNERAGLISP